MQPSIFAAHLTTRPVLQTKKKKESWHWSILNCRGFGKKPKFTVPEAQSIPSRVKARMEELPVAFGFINSRQFNYAILTIMCPLNLNVTGKKRSWPISLQ
jgi:hypothetical protein